MALAEEALRRANGRVDAQTWAMLLITSARANGAIRQGSKAADALLSAEDALVRTTDPVADYAPATGPAGATISSRTGKTLSELGDHRNAEQHRRAALAGRAPEKYLRVHALTLGELASTLDSRGQMDEAVSTLGEALDLMDGITSKRNTESIQSMRNTMRRYQARGVPGAAALSECARKALAT